MSRKTADITITDDNRDHGKVFRIREMSAFQAEKWALKAFLAMSKSGVTVPDEISEMGFAGLLVLGIQSLRGVAFGDLEPLLDESTSCISIVRDSSRAAVESHLMDGDVEEVSTLFLLRKELFTLHSGFTLPVGRSKSAAPSAGASA